MADEAAAALVQEAIEAHGGASLWNAFIGIEAEISAWGFLFTLKRRHALRHLRVWASTHEPRFVFHDFPRQGLRAELIGDEEVRLLDDSGEVLERRVQPRRAFPWTEPAVRLGRSGLQLFRGLRHLELSRDALPLPAPGVPFRAGRAEREQRGLAGAGQGYIPARSPDSLQDSDLLFRQATPPPAPGLHGRGDRGLGAGGPPVRSLPLVRWSSSAHSAAGVAADDRNAANPLPHTGRDRRASPSAAAVAMTGREAAGR